MYNNLSLLIFIWFEDTLKHLKYVILVWERQLNNQHSLTLVFMKQSVLISQ